MRVYRALTMIVFTMIVPAITHDDSATSPHIHTAHTSSDKYVRAETAHA